MYRRNAQGWLKHLDFFMIDEAVLQAAFMAASLIRHHALPYRMGIYQDLAIIYAMMDALAVMLLSSMHNVLSRGWLKEAEDTVKHCLVVFLGTTAYMFALKQGDSYSRTVLFLTLLFHAVLGYLTRMGWKRFLLRYGMPIREKGTMVAVLEPETAEAIMGRLLGSRVMEYRVIGAVLSRDDGWEEVCGIPVVSTLEGAAGYICREWIDSVYIDCPSADPEVLRLMDACHQMAVPVHYHVPGMGRDGARQFVEKVGGTAVLTTTINYLTPTQAFLKRCMDIAGGLVGSILAVLVMLAVGPAVRKASPGPVLYSQERIGRNGKRFRIRKIRSMYLDADERKAELMGQNRVGDGMMFKLDFDPRVIGNELLPDGTQKTGIGDFIRRTSLDEFPQFFNVLLGQMSLVGTRPPTPDEWERYEYHHRARLACKPGITGMWQTSGRSEITDFEEVVKLDTEYITNWSFALDVKMILKTFGVVFKGRGAM